MALDEPDLVEEEFKPLAEAQDPALAFSGMGSPRAVLTSSIRTRPSRRSGSNPSTRSVARMAPMRLVNPIRWGVGQLGGGRAPHSPTVVTLVRELHHWRVSVPGDMQIGWGDQGI